MKCWRIATLTMSMFLPVSAFAVNPFLDVKDDKPVSAKFRGAEWVDSVFLIESCGLLRALNTQKDAKLQKSVIRTRTSSLGIWHLGRSFLWSCSLNTRLRQKFRHSAFRSRHSFIRISWASPSSLSVPSVILGRLPDCYGFADTICGAGLFASSWALTF